MKQDMEAVKVTSEADLQAMQSAIKKMEGDIRNNVGNNAGDWPVGNSFNKSAMQHKAISNLKSRDIDNGTTNSSMQWRRSTEKTG